MNPISFYIGAFSATACILGLLAFALAFALYMWRGLAERTMLDRLINEQRTKGLLVPALTLVVYGGIGVVFSVVLHLVIKAMS